MIEMNEKRPDFGAITVVKKKNGNKEKKELYKPAEREEFIVRATDISDLNARTEALCTLACLISGRKVEIEDGKINLYFSHLFSRPFCTITDNPELVSLLEELVH
jgi:hypothetical protein